jgi:hypothetical protein
MTREEAEERAGGYKAPPCNMRFESAQSYLSIFLFIYMKKPTTIQDLRARRDWYANFLLTAPESHPMWDRHYNTYCELTRLVTDAGKALV